MNRNKGKCREKREKRRRQCHIGTAPTAIRSDHNHFTWSPHSNKRPPVNGIKIVFGHAHTTKHWYFRHTGQWGCGKETIKQPLSAKLWRMNSWPKRKDRKKKSREPTICYSKWSNCTVGSSTGSQVVNFPTGVRLPTFLLPTRETRGIECDGNNLSRKKSGLLFF